VLLKWSVRLDWGLSSTVLLARVDLRRPAASGGFQMVTRWCIWRAQAERASRLVWTRPVRRCNIWKRVLARAWVRCQSSADVDDGVAIVIAADAARWQDATSADVW